MIDYWVSRSVESANTGIVYSSLVFFPVPSLVSRPHFSCPLGKWLGEK